MEEFLSDPGLQHSILSYDLNIRDEVRRASLQRGPCQPHAHDFEQTEINSIKHRFVASWFKKYKNWLKYGVTKMLLIVYVVISLRLNEEAKQELICLLLKILQIEKDKTN